MASQISSLLYKRVGDAVKRTCRRASDNSKMVLTESDLQAWIFADLVHHEVRAEVDAGLIDVHCQTSFLDLNGRLGLRPDIVLFDPQEYTAESDGSLFQRKGFTFWGSAIALELKLHRANETALGIDDWKADIDKLVDIRTRLYPEGDPQRFYCAFTLLSKGIIAEEQREVLRRYGMDKNIDVWLCPSEVA